MWSFWAMTECEQPLFSVLFAAGGGRAVRALARAWTETAEFRETHPGAPLVTRETAELAARQGEAALQPPLRVLDAQLRGGTICSGRGSARPT